MIFLNANELKLINGGYLASTKDGKPVTHAEFVHQQTLAHSAAILAGVLKTKNFKGVKADTFGDALEEARKILNETEKVTYATKEEVEHRLLKQLKEEAMSFIKNVKNNSEVDRLNDSMQTFNDIHTCEEIGLYFTEGLVKLNKIYTIAEILEFNRIILAHS